MTQTPYPPEAPKDCALCPRLVEYRHAVAVKEPAWFNGAVPSFGDEAAELLVIGLAPGLRGANRTGRPFTGDFGGDLLYATHRRSSDFAKGTYAADPGRRQPRP
jgi:uracil-DNA glycosylase